LLGALPLVAPFLAQMVEQDCLDLCIHRVATLSPLLGLLKRSAEVRQRLPLLIAHAKQLLPYSESLVPYAEDLVVHADVLLTEANWKMLQPHLEALLEVYPLIRKHMAALVANMDVLLPHMDRLAPHMLDLSHHADKLCPHMRKLSQVRKKRVYRR
jgi:hypothetical protein